VKNRKKSSARNNNKPNDALKTKGVFHEGVLSITEKAQLREKLNLNVTERKSSRTSLEATDTLQREYTQDTLTARNTVLGNGYGCFDGSEGPQLDYQPEGDSLA